MYPLPHSDIMNFFIYQENHSKFFVIRSGAKCRINEIRHDIVLLTSLYSISNRQPSVNIERKNLWTDPISIFSNPMFKLKTVGAKLFFIWNDNNLRKFLHRYFYRQISNKIRNNRCFHFSGFRLKHCESRLIFTLAMFLFTYDIPPFFLKRESYNAVIRPLIT